MPGIHVVDAGDKTVAALEATSYSVAMAVPPLPR
jgi:hypothetical protein